MGIGVIPFLEKGIIQNQQTFRFQQGGSRQHTWALHQDNTTFTKTTNIGILPKNAGCHRDNYSRMYTTNRNRS